jgi:hypothetical protein
LLSKLSESIVVWLLVVMIVLSCVFIVLKCFFPFCSLVGSPQQ